MMYVHTPFPNIVYALDLTQDGTIIWKYEPMQDPNVIPVMCCDTVNRGVAYAERHDHPAPGRHDGRGAQRQDRRGEVERSTATRAKGETNTATVLPVKDKVIIGVSGGEFGVQGYVTAYNLKTGEQAWRAYSTGPGRPDADRSRRRPPSSASRSARTRRIDTWEGDQWKIGGGTTWGWYSYDPELDLVLLRHRQPLDLEPEPASRRQQLVDDHLRPRPGRRHGQVGLPDDPARRVGLRRHQRDDPRRPRDRRRRRASCWSTSTATASATR